MNKSSGKANPDPIRLENLLDLPDAPDFESVTPGMTMEQMIRLSEAMLPVFNALPNAEEQRLRTKCRLPFRLLEENEG